MTMLSRHKLLELNDAWNPVIECCGIILRDFTLVPLQNHSSTPELNFIMKWEDYEPYRDQIIATWHTHPHESANLSVADYLMFKSNPEWRHFIVARDIIWAYSTRNSRVFLDKTYSIPRAPEGSLS